MIRNLMETINWLLSSYAFEIGPSILGAHDIPKRWTLMNIMAHASPLPGFDLASEFS